MIVLLSCSMNLLGNSHCIPSTGEVTEDSTLIAYDDIRIVNSKLIELDYEKDINKKLKSVIKNDSVIIGNLYNTVDVYKRYSRKTIKQRNILGGSAIGFLIAFIIVLIK